MVPKRLFVVLCLAVAMTTLAACEAEDSAGGGGSADTEQGEQSGDEAKDDCGSKATGDCTPKVGPNEGVRVDGLTWRIKSARSATELGDQEFGLGEKANGRFIVVTLEATSNKDESVTLTNEVFQLDVDGKKYDTDTDGTIAAVGSGEEPFFLEDIGPDSTITAKVVFDVPESVLSKKPSMRFNELGFGSTHAFIRLPSISSS